MSGQTARSATRISLPGWSPNEMVKHLSFCYYFGFASLEVRFDCFLFLSSLYFRGNRGLGLVWVLL